MKKKNIIYTGIISCLLLASASCSDYLDINDNPNYPANAEPNTLLPSGIAGVASEIGGHYQLYGGLWMQQYTQCHVSNQYISLFVYNISNATDSRMWSIPYATALPDFDLVIKKAEATKQWNYWAIAKVMTAFTYHFLVDTYGSIPFTEALKADEGIFDPKYDDSKTVVYPGIIAILDEVVAKAGELSSAGLPIISIQDFVFGGSKGNDMKNWVTFAKSLKLKLLMRDFDANKTAIQALLTENDLLTIDAKMDVFQDLENKSNPLYENDRRKLNTPNNLSACVTLCDYLKKYNDPRLADFYNPNADGTGTSGLKYGDRPSSSVLPISAISNAVLAPRDPVYFMSASEVAFLKAEAYARLGDAANAKTNYDEAVTLAFARWKKDASTFIATGGAYAFDGKDLNTMLTSIITQKWIASTRCQAWDAWFDFNRTALPVLGSKHIDEEGYVFGQLTPCIGTTLGVGEFPRRLLYPKISSDNNDNTPEVIPLATKQWWHK